MKHLHLSAMAFLALLVATLACSLTTVEPVPTAVPTVDTTATFLAIVPEESAATVQIVGISPQSPIAFGSTVIIDVQANHEDGIQWLELAVVNIDDEFPDVDPASIEIGELSNASFGTGGQLILENGPQVDVQQQLVWQSFIPGNYVLQVFSNPPGASNRVRIELEAPDNIVDGASDGSTGTDGSGDGTGGDAGSSEDVQPCVISPSEGTTAVRGGPGSGSVLLDLSDEAVADAIGRDSTWQGWYRITLDDGREGWVNALLVEREGDCTAGVHLELIE